MKIREDTNEHGTPISVHKCPDCGEEFTVCPPADEDWGGCLSPGCESYDTDRDADGLFGGTFGNIALLDDHRPHLTINTNCIGIRECHIIPVALVEQWIGGYAPISEIPDSVIRAILHDWLELI